MEFNSATKEIVKQLPNVNSNLINQFLDDYVDSLSPKPKNPFYIDINIDIPDEASILNQHYYADVHAWDCLQHYINGEQLIVRINFTNLKMKVSGFTRENGNMDFDVNQIEIPINSIIGLREIDTCFDHFKIYWSGTNATLTDLWISPDPITEDPKFNVLVEVRK